MFTRTFLGTNMIIISHSTPRARNSNGVPVVTAVMVNIRVALMTPSSDASSLHDEVTRHSPFIRGEYRFSYLPSDPIRAFRFVLRLISVIFLT